MQAVLGFATLIGFLLLITVGRVSVLVALVLVPIVTGIGGGFGTQLGAMALDGFRLVAPVGIMIMFAVLYFGLMMEAGLFRPLIGRLVRLVRGDPRRLCLVTALLPMTIALDGDGATTFLISVTALLPLHKQMNMKPVILPCIVGLAAGVMNLLPWGGPTARTLVALEADVSQIFSPLILPMMFGVAWVLLAAWIIGRQEQRRLVVAGPSGRPQAPEGDAAPDTVETEWRFWFNVLLTLALIASLFGGLAPLPLLFCVAFCIAAAVNLPSWEDQHRLLNELGPSVVVVVSMVLAAGVFTGILSGTGMLKALAEATSHGIPASFTAHLPKIVALLGVPLSLMFTPDAFYYGILPVIAGTYDIAGGDRWRSGAPPCSDR